MSKFPFFGTGEIAATVLRILIEHGMPPAIVVTSPDRKTGRKQELTPSKVKVVALEHGLDILQPDRIDAALCEALSNKGYEVFVVVDYGAILPKHLLAIPPKGVVNMHPSLLPRLRGPSPIRTAILHDEKRNGVSVMLLDEAVDHGPLLGQREVATPTWPMKGKLFDVLMASEGARLLIDTLPGYVAGTIVPTEQEHSKATHSRFITKEHGKISLHDDGYANYLKYCAFDGWPGVFTFFERNDATIRVQIVDASLVGKRFVVATVKPEGKNVLSYDEFLRSGAKPL